MTLPYRRALITGVSGQDGALLAAELLRAGVVVTGTHRPRSDFWRLRELGIANVASWSFSFGSPVFGSATTPISQPLPKIVATWPLAITASWLASFVVAPPTE